MTRFRHLPARLRRCARGATAIEFALLAPALLLLIFGIIEFSRAMQYQSTLQHAVATAVRYGALDGAPSEAQIQQKAVESAPGMSVTTANFTVTITAGSPEIVQVDASYDFDFVISNLFPYDITLTATARAPRP